MKCCQEFCKKHLLKGNLVIKYNLLQLLDHPLAEMLVSEAMTWQPGNIDIWTAFEHNYVIRTVASTCTIYILSSVKSLYFERFSSVECRNIGIGNGSGKQASYINNYN